VATSKRANVQNNGCETILVTNKLQVNRSVKIEHIFKPFSIELVGGM